MTPRPFILAVLLFSLVAYPLSLGPVAAHYYYSIHPAPSSPDPPDWLLAIYRPLDSLCNSSFQVDAAFRGYVALWKPAGATEVRLRWYTPAFSN